MLAFMTLEHDCKKERPSMKFSRFCPGTDCCTLPLIVTQATSASLIANCDSQSELSMHDETLSTAQHHYRIDCGCSFNRVMLPPREVLSSAGV